MKIYVVRHGETNVNLENKIKRGTPYFIWANDPIDELSDDSDYEYTDLCYLVPNIISVADIPSSNFTSSVT